MGLGDVADEGRGLVLHGAGLLGQQVEVFGYDVLTEASGELRVHLWPGWRGEDGRGTEDGGEYS